jgi:hypothetical protein
MQIANEYLVIQAWGEMMCTAPSYIVADQEMAAAAHSFMITYSADADTGSLTGGNDVALIAVPEPATHVLALSAAVLLAWRYLCRKSCS